MRKFQFIWEFLEGNRKRMAAMIVLVCVYAFLNLCSPLLFSFMIDNVIHQQLAANPVLAWLLESLGGAQYLQRNLWMGAAAILAINALICVCVFLRGYWNAVISEEVCRKVRNRLYAHLQSLPFSYHVRIKTGDLVQRCTSDVDQIRRFLSGQISEECMNDRFLQIIDEEEVEISRNLRKYLFDTEANRLKTRWENVLTFYVETV